MLAGGPVQFSETGPMDIKNLQRPDVQRQRGVIRLVHALLAVLCILLLPKLHHADSPEPDASLMEPVQQHSLASESANWRQRLRRYDKHEPKQAATVSQASHRAKTADASSLARDNNQVAPAQHTSASHGDEGCAVGPSLPDFSFDTDGSCYGSSAGCGTCANASCGSCFSGCGSGCSGCELCGSDPGCVWVRAEYLLWWMDGFDTPPILTTSPNTVDRDVAGVLGETGTRVLFGGGELADGTRSGGRITLGFWLDSCATTGVQASYFGLEDEKSEFRAVSDGDPILAQPFFNLEPGMEGQDAELIAFPSLFSGRVNVRAKTRLQGADVLIHRALCRSAFHRVDLLLGWRYNRLDDELFLQNSREVLSSDTGLTVGTTFEEFDPFETENTFHGATIGALTTFCKRRWTFELALKLALGNNHSQVNIDGQAMSRVPVGDGFQEAVTPAGLLAQATNIGSFENDDFAVIPELGVTIRYDMTCNLTATFGYTFIYWSQVVRAGDQIDFDLNLSQLAPGGLVGAPRPAFPGTTTDMWAQGLSLGLEYCF